MICYITDLGLCRPASEKHNDKIYGVLPYIAPEVLKNQPYTQASDIYSLGIIAYELLVNTYPYPEMNDMVLALKVHQDADPEKRLTAGEVHETFYSWLYEVIENKENSPFYQQYLEIEKEYSHFSQNTPYQIHPTATLTSKPINTKPTNKLLQKIEENNISQSVDLDIDKLDDYLKKLKSEEQQSSGKLANFSLTDFGSSLKKARLSFGNVNLGIYKQGSRRKPAPLFHDPVKEKEIYQLVADLKFKSHYYASLRNFKNGIIMNFTAEDFARGIKNVAETRQNLKITANARDKRDFNMFAVEKGAKTSNLHLEPIQGTKDHCSIRTGGQ
ncbi:5556_t:CDS:2 [Funneliformis geosporum]|uniref:5556_t:CDS:1 n=1 Tax=Funneliformis geosporum TaxID=1117311 RepID=A0A9W4WL30_9GLOM|nr:5556_t:CDS:2 [Funneliformis geosporum]